jgi:uncharacterized membrane protein YraQ (UPF0718 family)
MARRTQPLGGESPFLVAQSVPGGGLAGAALPGSMTTVPPAIPLKRQGAGDGSLLAFIITSSLLGPSSIVLTFTMFGPVRGVLRVALPLIAVRGLGWGLQRFGLHSNGEEIDEDRSKLRWRISSWRISSERTSSCSNASSAVAAHS